MENAKKQFLNRGLFKSLEQEYAIRYLGHMGIESSPKNIKTFLNDYPLDDANPQNKHAIVEAGDSVVIYPHRVAKKKGPVCKFKKEELKITWKPPI
jgi:hypothetical protein